jgi:hypothetical protein
VKIKKVDDKPMVIHTKEKAKIHSHEPKSASIKGSNIYTVDRTPKIKKAAVSEMPAKVRNTSDYIKGKNKQAYRKSTKHGTDSTRENSISRFRRTVRESTQSVKLKETNLHVAGRTGAAGVKAATDQMEGGQEVQQAAYFAYEATRPVTGTASKGAALFRKKSAEAKKRKIKKVEAGKKLAKKTAKKAATETAKNTRQYIRAKRGKRNYNPFYYCGICGRALSTSKRVGGDILLCYSSRIEKDSLCKDNRVELTKIEDAVMKTVNMYAAAYLDEKGIKKAGRSKTVSPEVKIETLEKSIRNMSSKKMALYSDYKDEKISREQYVEMSRKMVDQIEDMNQKIEKLKSEMQVEDTVSNKFTQQLESVIHMESFNLELIQKVIKKVVINGEDNIEIVWNTDDPFFK